MARVTDVVYAQDTAPRPRRNEKEINNGIRRSRAERQDFWDNASAKLLSPQIDIPQAPGVYTIQYHKSGRLLLHQICTEIF
ncbi:hypothetical protein EVAR_56715_1 [Eumeta japonica]|uniref:Uncharacterized protein n=1 Tax=Eumeta variegata TaxID=151549 RepID=A0A4C1XZ75_EUMVA|nr:hypothetical protein EVAR_56715_1 [Eumeta japonica]